MRQPKLNTRFLLMCGWRPKREIKMHIVFLGWTNVSQQVCQISLVMIYHVNSDTLKTSTLVWVHKKIILLFICLDTQSEVSDFQNFKTFYFMSFKINNPQASLSALIFGTVSPFWGNNPSENSGLCFCGLSWITGTPFLERIADDIFFLNSIYPRC